MPACLPEHMKTTYAFCKVDNTNIFYRTAGNRSNPTVLLLHGFPSSSHMFRNLIPLLAVWGKNDPSFIPAGAEAFRNDLPNAEIHFVDSGHFALESHLEEIATLMIEFLKKHLSDN